MRATRVKRVGALLVGLSLVAAACGSDDDADSGAVTTEAAETTDAAETTEAPDTTEEMTEDTEAPDTTEAATDGGETVQAAPSCEGDSDGVLNIATVLPETGNLAFLGPPEFAGAERAVQ